MLNDKLGLLRRSINVKLLVISDARSLVTAHTNNGQHIIVPVFIELGKDHI